MRLTKKLRKPFSPASLFPATIAGVITLTSLLGCAARPSPEVLKPLKASEFGSLKPVSNNVSVLSASNRARDREEGALGTTRSENLTYEHYVFSVPNQREGTTISYPAGHPDPQQQYAVVARNQLTKAGFVKQVLKLVQPDGTVGVFVHGYNYSYQEALYRTVLVSTQN